MIAIILAGAAKRIEREKLFVDAGAWNSARLNAFAYHKPGEMPSFDAFRGRPAASGPRERPDWRAMKSRVLMYNAAIGGELITK